MIQEVEMINWRAYEKRSFTFKPGLNFIMGPNGRGKTSILEAIAYGLTGEPSVLSDRDMLLRNPDKPATVKLKFKIKDILYRIERTQMPGKAGEASIFELSTNKKLASYHKNVTEKVEELMGVSADFLRRIVYMAEGDVFRFLQDPPGKAMNQQVQHVLGITQLDEFQTSLKAAQSELKEKSRSLKSFQQRIDDSHITPHQTIDGMINFLNIQKEKIIKDMLDYQGELSRLIEENQSLISLEKKIQDRKGYFKVGPAYVEKLETEPLVKFFDELETQTKNWRDDQIKSEKEISRLEGQHDSHKRVLELISKIDDESGEVPCPVCKKPMTPEEHRKVVEDEQNEVNHIEKKISQFSKFVLQRQNNITDAMIVIDNLSEIRNNVVHGQYREINPNMTMLEIQEIASKSKDNPKQKELTENITNIKTKLNELENARANLISIQNQLQKDGFSNPDEITNMLVQIETRILAVDAARKAAENTLTDMRDVGLDSIYTQIASIWNNYMQHGNWTLRFDTEGLPKLVEDSDREFAFGQFSGGEKTALLVMIHTVIAHHFSNCDFLLVDEPLEHLDPINRRSLIQFFVSACQNKFFDQAFISTYEESLVRKYISKEYVNIIHIR